MAKKLLVRTPQTRDGVNLKYDKDKQVVYKESIVELRAKPLFESLNARLPEHLRHELKETEVNEELKGSSTDALQRKLDELEAQKKNKSLEQRIAELEKELAARDENGPAGAGTQTPGPGTVEEVIEKIKGLTTVADVEIAVKGDDRKGVTDAAKKRIKELESAAK